MSKILNLSVFFGIGSGLCDEISSAARYLDEYELESIKELCNKKFPIHVENKMYYFHSISKRVAC